MSISTLSFNSATRTSLLKLQSSVNEASQEVNSGRHADIGRTLGRLTGSAISARAQETTFKEQQTSNLIVSNRLDNIDASMATVSEGAEALANNLIGAGLSTAYGTIADQAKSGIQQMSAALNANSGQYLFGGDNTDVQPIKTDAAALAARSTATAASFDAFVLASTGGTDVSQVSAADMTAYLTTGYTDSSAVVHTFSDLFSDANWAANWSTASDGTIASPISKTETITGSATANDQSFRSIASAYTMLSSINLGSLSEATRTAVTQTAAQQLKLGTDGITAMRADVGTKLKRIESANTELLRQQDIMEATVDSLESVDITEASLRVNALKTQLETAYTVTGKIQSLSLLNYI